MEIVELKRGVSMRGTFIFNVDISSAIITSMVRDEETLTKFADCEIHILDAASGTGVYLVKDTTNLQVGKTYLVDVDCDIDGVVDSTPTDVYKIIQDITYVG